MKRRIFAALLGVTICLAGVGLFLSSSPTASGQGAEEPVKYKGTRACKACHAEKYEAWEEMPHSKAFETLTPEQVAGGKDPKGRVCVQCHTTGFGQGGFESVEKTPKLVNVGCESCHGAGGAHVKVMLEAMMNEEETVADTKISKSVGCTGCHNPHVSYKKIYGGK